MSLGQLTCHSQAVQAQVLDCQEWNLCIPNIGPLGQYRVQVQVHKDKYNYTSSL